MRARDMAADGVSSAPTECMRTIVFAVLFLLVGKVLPAASLPLTAKEIGLMLRSGYTSEAIAQDLATKHFAGSCDEGTKKMLAEAGAAPALINAIASGIYAIPPAETAHVQEELAAQTRRRATEAEASRKFDTLYQNQLARTRAVTTTAPGDANTIYPLVKGDLVCWKDGSLARFDDQSLEKKKLIALYFSAHWCGPCRKFTPQLVEYYNRVASQHPEFELIFVSNDRSPFGFQTYMKDMQMPWPAIDYQKVSDKTAITKYAGNGIPDLVLLDASGRILSDSYAGQQYLGPQKVLADLDSIFANGQVTGWRTIVDLRAPEAAPVDSACRAVYTWRTDVRFWKAATCPCVRLPAWNRIRHFLHRKN